MKKKILAITVLISILLSMAVMPVSAASSGKCGGNLTWTLDDYGTLTISGTGAMWSYRPKASPFYCSPAKKLVIESGVTSIGEYAFYNCIELTSVTLPSSLNYIADSAFSDCINLISLDIPSGVNNIGMHAFNGCISLVSIDIPSSVKIIGSYAFLGCSSLTSIYVSEENQKYSSLNGVLFNKDKTHIIVCPPKTSGVYIIPDSVTYIYSGAFYGCSNLTSIEIPSSVTYIYEYAFYGCSSLSSIDIPDSVKHISSCSFRSCTSLTSVDISNSATSIGAYAFEGCCNLKSVSISNSITSIESGTFSQCSSLTSIEIPDSVKSIGDCAFDGCTSLNVITIPHSVTSIGYSAFRNCTSLSDVYYNGTLSEWNSIFIGASNSNLTNAQKHCLLTVTYTGDYTETITADYLTSVTFPTAPYGYTYTFKVNDEVWDGVVKGDTTVVVTKVPINYTVTYTGEYTGIDNADYLTSVTFPTAPYGYTYTFKVNDELWDGVVKGNTTVVVTKAPINYTITYTGDYTETLTADYWTILTLPTPPENYIYRFIVNGAEWDGIVRGDTTVNVQKLCDLTELDITNIEDIIKDQDSIYGKFYEKTFTPQVTVSENASYSIYADSECTQILSSNFRLARGENTFYIRVTAESGRESVYKVTIDRDIPESLGTLSVLQTVRDTMTLKLDNKISGNPEVVIVFAPTQYEFSDPDNCAKRTAFIGIDRQTLYITGLSPDETRYFKAIAKYDDIETESSVVLGRTALSWECFVTDVLSPAGGKIDHEKGTISDLRVMNRFDEIKIDVDVSKKATWELYFDKQTLNICENKTLSLLTGEEKTAYIKVTAEDGTEKVYSISIYRQTKSEKPVISAVGNIVTITSKDGKNIIYTIDGTYPAEFNGNLYTGPFAVPEGAKIRAIAKQDGIDEYSDIVSYTLEESEETLLGDVNDSGKVNSQDVAILARHLAGWTGYETIKLKAGDVNGNGKVNSQDVAILARHLAGWAGYETLPYLK